jgi:hypothetical protein
MALHGFSLMEINTLHFATIRERYHHFLFMGTPNSSLYSEMSLKKGADKAGLASGYQSLEAAVYEDK